MSTTTTSRRQTNQAHVALGAAMVIVGALVLWLSWRYFVRTEQGQLIDDAAFRGSAIGRNRLWQAAEPVLDIVDEAFVVLVVVATAAIAVLRRRWRLAVHVAILVGGANITTQVLKHLVLERPPFIDAIDNSLPSGHTTVAASASVALVFVVPRALKPPVAIIGAGYTAATGVSTMIGGWHRPSDVVAAIAVVLLWAGVAVLFGAEQPGNPASPASGGNRLGTVATALLAATALVTGILATGALMSTRDVLNSRGAVTERSDLLTAYVGGAVGVVSATAVLFAAVLAADALVRDRRT
jgi:hypothetical protein